MLKIVLFYKMPVRNYINLIKLVIAEIEKNYQSRYAAYCTPVAVPARSLKALFLA